MVTQIEPLGLEFDATGVTGAARGDLSNVPGATFGAKSVAVSASYAPRPAIIGRAVKTFDIEDYYAAADTERTNHAQALTNLVAAANAGGSNVKILIKRELSGALGNHVITGGFVEMEFSRSDPLTTTTTTGNLFGFTGQHVEVRDPFILPSASATSGYLFAALNTSGQFDLHGLRSAGGGWSGIYLDGAEVTVYDCRSYGLLKDFVRFSPTFAGQGRVKTCRVATAVGNTNQGVGFVVTAGDTVVIDDVDATTFQIGLLVQVPAAGFLRNLNLSNVFGDGYGRTDAANAKGIVIDASAAGAEISRIVGVNTWGSASAGPGMQILGNVRQAEFTNHRAIANGRHGVQIIAGATTPNGIRFVGGQFSGNSLSSPGTYDDMHIDDGVNDVSILGGHYGFSTDLSLLGITNSSAYAIGIAGTSHTGLDIAPSKTVAGLSGAVTPASLSGSFIGDGVPARAEGDWTPTVTAETPGGTPAVIGACTGQYQRVGRLVIWSMTINVTTKGTAAGEMRATLPFTARAGISGAGYGQERTVNGKGVSINTPGGSTTARLKNYDNSDAWVDGGNWNCSGHYWI